MAPAGEGQIVEASFAEIANSGGQPFSALFISSEAPAMKALSSQAAAQWQRDMAAAESASASGDSHGVALALKSMLQFLSDEPAISQTWLEVVFADGRQVRIEHQFEVKRLRTGSEGIVAWKMQDLSSGETIAVATWKPGTSFAADGESLASAVLARASNVAVMPHAVSAADCGKVLIQGPRSASFGCLTEEHFNDSPAEVVASMLESFPADAAERLNLALALVQGISDGSVRFATDDGVLPLADTLVPLFSSPWVPPGDILTITRIEGEDQPLTPNVPSSGIVGLFPGRSGWIPMDPNLSTAARLDAFFGIAN